MMTEEDKSGKDYTAISSQLQTSCQAQWWRSHDLSLFCTHWVTCKILCLPKYSRAEHDTIFSAVKAYSGQWSQAQQQIYNRKESRECNGWVKVQTWTCQMPRRGLNESPQTSWGNVVKRERQNSSVTMWAGDSEIETKMLLQVMESWGIPNFSHAASMPRVAVHLRLFT